MSKTNPSVYNIPAGAPFAKVLARYVWEEAEKRGIALPDIRILLPTRRACRTVREAFLQLTNGKPLLLPQLQPLGDIDEEELSFALTGNMELQTLLDMPPALPPLKRRLMLARLIDKNELFEGGFDQALKLADALGHFMDQIYTEDLDIKNLAALVPEDFANHWQITLDFLKILNTHWPDILQENGVIDAADRRNRLLNTLSSHWQNAPPENWIIAAGSTGSIPAVGKLLKTIAHLPQGEVILPGLDSEMGEQSWNALEETHPQYNLREILKIIGTDRIAVNALYKQSQTEPDMTSSRVLAREVMRPASTTQQWIGLKGGDIQDALTRISLYECENPREEAQIIALIMRETLGIENEKNMKTCALITPDRDLAKRVKTACQRWGIAVDDSAGQSVGDTPLGSFLALSLEAALSNLAPAALLSFLKHPCSNANMPRSDYLTALSELEIKALRGPRPAPGLEGIKQRLGEDISPALQTLLRVIEDQMTALIEALNSSRHLNFKDIVRVHLRFCEGWAARSDKPGTETLWQGEAGEAAAGFFAELLDHAHLMPDMDGHTIKDVQAALLRGLKTRPAYGTHPRLMILGQLEARLINADTLILAGLNEGSWPAEPAADPWMSRPMRGEFGLPAPERSIGLAAHDFAQGLCAPRVILTRSLRADGAPTVPARWLQRLDAVLQAASISRETITNGPHKAYAALLNAAQTVTPAPRPAPCPPLDKRPARLSVTKIDTLLRDPYSIYARYILNLEPLEPVEKQIDAKEKGTLLHNILERFINENPDKLPADSAEKLISIAQEELKEFHEDPALWQFWWPRFARISDWLAGYEQEWRKTARPFKTEIKGAYTLNFDDGTAFTLSAKADRIDRMRDGGAALIDYKSGGSFTRTGFEDGRQPQLPLEALILVKGGFADINAKMVGYMGYWIFTGANPPGNAKISIENADLIQEIIENTDKNLKNLIEAYQNPEISYISLPNSQNLPRFNDYEHLARVKEWSALEDAGESSDIGEAA